MPHHRSLPLMLLLACFTLPASGCGSRPASGAGSKADAAGPLKAKVVEAALQPWPRTIRVQGMLAAHDEAVIGAKVAGRVDKVQIDRGSPVEEGQVLVELEMQDFDLRVQQAEAQLESVRSKLGLREGEPESKLNPLRAPPVMQELAMREEAQIELDRLRQLARQTAAAMEQVQKQEATVKVMKARYDSAVNNVYEQLSMLALRRVDLAFAKQQRADARIVAPFKGIVQMRHVSPGTYLRVGEPVAIVVRIDPLRFHAAVPERDVRQIKVGEALTLHSEGLPKPIVAKVNRISPSLERQSLSLMLEADIPNPGSLLRAGHFAEADIVVDRQATALAIPDSAVFEFAGVEKVWLVKDGRAREQRVLTDRRLPGRVEVLSGLAPGDRVLEAGLKGRAGPIDEEAASGGK